MYIRKVLRLLGIVIASLALVTMIVSASGNLVSSSFAQGEQKFTAKMIDKEEVLIKTHQQGPHRILIRIKLYVYCLCMTSLVKTNVSISGFQIYI